MIGIKRALISVYDKTGIVEIGQFLAKNAVEIISTGKTSKILRAAGVEVIEVSDYTESAEIMGGRVKTLHHKIYGGILGVRGKHNFVDTPQIDLVITNLYPFIQVAEKTSSSEEEVIEQIDIGGVSLIRAAAKNFRHVCIITDIADYKSFNNININLDYRRKLAIKAFATISRYDNAIYEWISKSSTDNFICGGEKVKSFRYGENPHQIANFYSNQIEKFPNQIQGKELSYNNVIDAEAAYRLILEFDEPTVAIIKHTNPCGVASSNDVVEAYNKALNCDLTSSFGGIVAVNREITENLARCIIKVFTEVVIAPSITKKALDIFAEKPKIRVLTTQFKKYDELNVRSAFGGFLVQDDNISLINEERVVTDKKPVNIEDLYFAWKVCKHVKSNAIVICKNKTVLGIGAGQTSRVDSVRIAIDKSKEVDLKYASLASDAFFPFDDCVKLASEVGIEGIIQPGGSISDREVIATANKNNISMVFTGMRHFKH